MKKRIARKSDNGSVLPMTEADVTAAAKKQRPRPPARPNRKGGSTGSLWGLKVLVPVLAGLALCVVIFLHFDKSTSGARLASRLDPLKDFLSQRKAERKEKRKKRKNEKRQRREEELKQRLEKGEAKAKNDPSAPLHHQLVAEQEDLPLYKFESLRYALQQSELVLLYFAASWCPMSSPVTEQLDSLFRDILLPPPPDPSSAQEKKDEAEKLMQRLLEQRRHGVSLVYVSSDSSKEDMESYVKDNWMVVPFDSPDRNNLKRHFKTCGKIEMESLGIETRDQELPALIVLAGSSHTVLTMEGVKDVQDRGQQAVDYWLELLKTSEEAA